MTTEEIAAIFAAARDAPTSFEDEQWIEGFEDGRQMIAHRFATTLFPDDTSARREWLTAARVD